MNEPTDDPDDDWAPLPPERLALRPGQLVDGASGVSQEELAALSPPPPPAAPPPLEGGGEPEEPAAPKAANEHGERMLRRLFGRVARTSDSDSIVTLLQRKEERYRRQQQRAACSEAELRGHFVKIDAAPDVAPPPLPPTFEVGAGSEIDPRELEDWFLQLPEQEQERLRKVWSDERSRHDWAGKAARTRLVRAAAYSGGVFFVTGVLMVILTGDLLRPLFYAPVGAVAGVAATLVGGTRFHFMCAGALGFTLVEGSNLLANPFLLYGLLLAISTMGLVGFDRELRRSAGHRDD